MIGIYKIENLITNKIYIGESIDIKQRWDNEYNAAFNPNEKSYNYPLQKDFRELGKENFSFSIIEECSIDELWDKEKYWINYYDSFNNGYNQTLGGNGFHKITTDTLNQIYNDLIYKNELTIEDISKQYNLSIETIKKN